MPESLHWSEWDETRDPALVRANAAIESVRRPPEAAGRPEPPKAAAESSPEPVAAPEGISQLLERVRTGDLSAVAALRRAIGR